MQRSIADEGADQTGSLLEAFGLPLQLQEDDLPQLAPASPSPRPGGLPHDSDIHWKGMRGSGLVRSVSQSRALGCDQVPPQH